MNEIIRYGNGIIQYSVVGSKRRKKTCEIIVDRDGVVVRTPLGKPASEIKRIVEEKRRWIFKKQLEFNGHDPQKPSPRAYSRRFIMGRTSFHASKVGVCPQKINIRKLKSRWGSATKDNVINLNENLLKAPKEVIDYVILHEICHLKIRDHSYRFWHLLKRFMPNYLDQKKWLDAHSGIVSD